ncbi:MAG: hypothetical protein HOY71_09880 [Nonomuraea sp.]|nr:hypothetical protein [Nonomuraea sp.]
MSDPQPPVQPAPVFGMPGPERLPAFIEPEQPRRRILPGITVVVVVLLALAYLVPAVLMSGSVLRGTKVGGIDIGGLTVTQAADKLRTELSAKLAKPVVVDIAGQKETIQPDEAGLELDVVGTIGQASSGFPSPQEVWRGLTGSTNLEPKITIDPTQLTRTVEGLAESVDKAPREGRISFTGLRRVVVTPRDGVLLDRPDAVKRISEAFLHARGNVALTLRPAKPETSLDDVKLAAADARKAISGPITLTIAGKQAQLTPETIAANLTFVPDGKGGLEPRFDAEKACDTVEGQLVDAAQAPQDATFQILNGKPVLVPSKVGRGVDDDQLGKDIVDMIKSGGDRVIPVSLASVKPEITTAEVNGLGIKEQVSTFTTSFDCCQPRVTNIRKMAADLDGKLIKPGDTFSLNDAIGARTREDGYVDAGQIVGGRMVSIVGGGVSQFATTLYNAAFLGGFEEVERTPMDYYADRYPAGRDAALLYPDLDLKFRNDSPNGVLIKTISSATSVTVTLWGTKRYDKIEVEESDRRNVTTFRHEVSNRVGCIATTGQQGFTIDVTRVFFQDGKEAKRDKKLTTKYRPQPQVTCATG